MKDLISKADFFNENGWASLPKPFEVSCDDEGDVFIEWAFGPQGHPASMRISLSLTSDGAIILCRLGPLWKAWPIEECKYTENLAKNLMNFLAQGKEITARWGSDPFWHKCKTNPNCKHGYIGNSAPYTKCPDCIKIRADIITILEAEDVVSREG